MEWGCLSFMWPEGNQSTLFLSGLIAFKIVPARGVPHLGRTCGRAELDRLLIVGLEASYRNLREEQISEIWYPELSLSL